MLVALLNLSLRLARAAATVISFWLYNPHYAVAESAQRRVKFESEIIQVKGIEVKGLEIRVGCGPVGAERSKTTNIR